MPPKIKRIEPGTLVTVTITVEGAEHDFHGTLAETTTLITHARDTGHGIDYIRYPANHAVAAQVNNPAPYALVHPVTGKPFDRNGIAEHGPDWFFSLFGLQVRLDSANVTLRKATKEGRAWVEANLSLDYRRQRLLDRVTAYDPALARDLDLLLEDVRADGYDAGCEAESRSHYC